MNTRFLFIVSLIVAVFAVWFYRNQGNIEAPIQFSESNIEYRATDILAVQTDESGIAEYSLTADDLTHYSDKNLDRLKSMTINWRPSLEQNVVINADEAEIYHDESKVIMTNNVIFASQQSRASHLSDTDSSKVKNSVTPPMRLMASELIGNLDKKVIYSNKPIKVTQSKNEFDAASFEANMQTGVYDFTKVAVTFMPPPRTNEPLF